ncbi:MAG: hypothetical protein KIS81_08145 [Maricaulaceae bacterium]|nr:hypothetical protein [Maricaulaceae bacterium]
MSALAALFAALVLGGAQEAEAEGKGAVFTPITASCVVSYTVSGGRAADTEITCDEVEGAADMHAEAERQLALLRASSRHAAGQPFTTYLFFDRDASGGWRPQMQGLMRIEPRYPEPSLRNGYVANCTAVALIRDGRASAICVTCNASGHPGPFESAFRRALSESVYIQSDRPERYEATTEFRLHGGPRASRPPYPACQEAG